MHRIEWIQTLQLLNTIYERHFVAVHSVYVMDKGTSKQAEGEGTYANAQEQPVLVQQ